MKIKTIAAILFFVSLFLNSHEAQSEEKWKESKSLHFIIYYKEAPGDFVKSVEEESERYYDEIAKNLGFTRYEGWLWDDRAKIYIYDNGDDYVQSGRQAGWSHGVASVEQKVIRTYPAAHGFFDSTLPHELGHIIFREFVGFKAQVPLWFEEGIAMYQEKARRWGVHQTVKKALEAGTFISLPDLTSTRLSADSDPLMVQLFYDESASVVQYLINDLGEYRFASFCRELEKGGPFEWTLQSVYYRFKNMEDLNKAWVEFLKTQ